VRLFNQDTKVQALKRAPLFEGLSRKELVLLARVTEDLEVPAGEVLCREGETGPEFFVIVEGKTDVTSKGKRVATRGDGDFVGEIALLEDTQANCDGHGKDAAAAVRADAPGLPPASQREPKRRAEGHASPRPPGGGAPADPTLA
jgi:CRP-like cAMP-binding protein